VTMEFGANFNSGDLSPAVWARRREDEGWDVLGCADHFFSMRRGAYPHLWVTLATFAAATTEVGLSSSFANNLLRSPVEFAQAALEMQIVSGGRFEAGLGAGWTRDEIDAAGLHYPSPAERAARYAEAMQIVRQIFDGAACRFDGRYYHVDLPKLRPQTAEAPPLVGSLGGPRTIREVGPLLDRVEVNVSSAATRGGALDLDLLARVERADLDALVRGVRDVNPTAPLGILVLCNVGDDERTRAYEEQMGGSFLGQFFGPPEKVADALLELEDLGLSRVQITPFFESSFELLAPFLGGS
jgi:alkanesulfonate monooxygenase SsuD/methylene tetrahydromethanopterin reductase-like flavin-dependent oxidoreductase (luciferase family)